MILLVTRSFLKYTLEDWKETLRKWNNGNSCNDKPLSLVFYFSHHYSFQSGGTNHPNYFYFIKPNLTKHKGTVWLTSLFSTTFYDGKTKACVHGSFGFFCIFFFLHLKIQPFRLHLWPWEFTSEVLTQIFI